MPVFTYKGLDARGVSVAGELEAADRRGALRALTALGVRPSSVAPRMDAARSVQEVVEGGADLASQLEGGQAGQPSFLDRLVNASRSRSATSLGFLQNLLMLLQSGMPMGDSLRLLQSRVGDPRQKELASALWRGVSEGGTLSAAMAGFPEFFGESHVQLVAAGEASGRLPVVLERVVAYLEESEDLKKKLMAALAYPLFIVLFALAVVVFFLWFLLPRVRALLETMGGQMQFFAKLLIWGAEVLVHVGPFVVAGVLVALVWAAGWRKSARGRAAIDAWLLSLPVVGGLLMHQHVLRSMSLLATLLDSGVNTPEALRLVERTVPNVVLRSGFGSARRLISEGESLSSAFRRLRMLPDLDVDVLSVGENTGNISSSLKRIYMVHRDTMSRSMGFLTVALTTVALLFAFSVVALIALSIVMSTLDISKSMTFGH